MYAVMLCYYVERVPCQPMLCIFALIPAVFLVLAVRDLPKCIITRDRYI
jgi:hypothetical protein